MEEPREDDAGRVPPARFGQPSHGRRRTAGNAPSLGIVVKGRDLPGPLCHVLQAFDDTAIVVAAGVANHAGPGSWRACRAARSVYGLEVEHPGTTRLG